MKMGWRANTVLHVFQDWFMFFFEAIRLKGIGLFSALYIIFSPFVILVFYRDPFVVLGLIWIYAFGLMMLLEKGGD